MPGRNTNMRNLHVQNSKTNSLNHNLQKFICIHSHTHPSIRRNPWPLCIQFYDFVLWCCHKYLRKLEGKRTDSNQHESSETQGGKNMGKRHSLGTLIRFVRTGLGPTKHAFCSPDSLRKSILLISMHLGKALLL